MTRVLVVEDSISVRSHLVSVLQHSGLFSAVDEAEDGNVALQRVSLFRPDLIALDVFLQKSHVAVLVKAIRAVSTAHIVLVSDAPRNCDEVFDALAAGAIDFLPKPAFGKPEAVTAFLQRLLAISRIQSASRGTTKKAAPVAVAARVAVLVIASSTGGPGALAEFLAGLPRDCPVPVVVAQHIAEGFDEGLVKWLASRTPLQLQLADSGTPLVAGHIYFGRSNCDISIRRGRRLEISRPIEEGYHPSGDVLFSTAVDVFADAVIAVVLSGIGADGAAGAAKVRKAGGLVFAQDKGSCVVFGMPDAVIKNGAATTIGRPIVLARAALEAIARPLYRGYT